MNTRPCESRAEILAGLRGQLVGEAAERLVMHLRDCAECRAFEQRERELDRALVSLPRRSAPPSLKRRLAREVRPARPWRAALLGLQRHWLVAASMTCAVAALLVVGVLRGQRESNVLLREAVNDHLRVLYAERAVEIASGGIHQVKPWFEGRLDFAPVLAFSGDDEFVLTGGAISYFIDRKAATFIFKRRLHVISLFVFRADGLPLPALDRSKGGRANVKVVSSRGFVSVIFQDGDLGYALVSDVEPATLERLAEKLLVARDGRIPP
jgi:anti-sigma factor RsiW